MSVATDVAARAALSLGQSSDALHAWAARLLEAGGLQGGTCIDIGCGGGGVFRHISSSIEHYIGCDAVQYSGFPSDDKARFQQVDLNCTPFDLPSNQASAVISVETIEHLENPRALFREIVRLARPGGLVVVTTPNQLSLLSKLTLFTRNEFNAFQEAPGLYPAHVTALLEIDLLRIAREVGLRNAAIHYSGIGRVPATRLHWPAWLGLKGRSFSDNVALVAKAE